MLWISTVFIFFRPWPGDPLGPEKNYSRLFKHHFNASYSCCQLLIRQNRKPGNKLSQVVLKSLFRIECLWFVLKNVSCKMLHSATVTMISNQQNSYDSYEDQQSTTSFSESADFECLWFVLNCRMLYSVTVIVTMISNQQVFRSLNRYANNRR